MTGKWLVAVLTALLLSGCSGSGAARHMTCPQTCERNYDSCADSVGANRSGPSFFGAGATCQRELSSCHRRCDLNAVQTKPAAANKPKSTTGETAEPRKTP